MPGPGMLTSRAFSIQNTLGIVPSGVEARDFTVNYQPPQVFLVATMCIIVQHRCCSDCRYTLPPDSYFNVRLLN
jgi:hypothetical protein